MSAEQVTEVSDTDDAAGGAFAMIPHVPVASILRPPPSAWRSRIVSGCVAMGVAGMLAVYLTRPTTDVDPNAPRVFVEVTGMHCPIQCGLRVQGALEKLPFVLPGSVTANPKTGIVTFAVMRADSVDADQVRQAVEKVGFGVRAVKTPDAVPHGEPSDVRTAPNK